MYIYLDSASGGALFCVLYPDFNVSTFKKRLTSSYPQYLASSTWVPNNSDQVLLLKAVYRDTVVGICYLHPKTILPGYTCMFNLLSSLQITFTSHFRPTITTLLLVLTADVVRNNLALSLAPACGLDVLRSALLDHTCANRTLIIIVT